MVLSLHNSVRSIVNTKWYCSNQLIHSVGANRPSLFVKNRNFLFI